MKNIKRVLALLLAILMLSSLLVACGQDTEDEFDADGSSALVDDGGEDLNAWGEKNYTHNIPEGTDYGGKKIRILVSSTDSYQREWYSDPRTDSLDNEIFKRNRTVQEEINVVLKFVNYSDASEMKTTITNA